MTPQQSHILRHALGIEQKGYEYRNHYCAAPGTKAQLDCETLVTMGHMRRLDNAGASLIGYEVTEEGKKAAG